MTTNFIDRTYPMGVAIKVGAANVGTGNGVSFNLPYDALLLRAYVVTTTAFDGTTPTLTLSDGTTTFANAVDLTSTGSETVANAPKYYPLGGTLTATLAGTAVTVGAGVVVAEYIRPGNGIAGVQE